MEDKPWENRRIDEIIPICLIYDTKKDEINHTFTLFSANRCSIFEDMYKDIIASIS